jgi:sulfur carrier protein
MNLVVNGETYVHTGSGDLSSLLQEMDADEGRVATMVNDAIVACEHRTHTVLNDGDRIEVLSFAGGGQ